MWRLPCRPGEAAAAPSAPEGPLPELTPADIANGWTPEAVREHVAQVEAAEHAALINRLFPEKQPLRVENCNQFDAHGW